MSSESAAELDSTVTSTQSKVISTNFKVLQKIRRVEIGFTGVKQHKQVNVHGNRRERILVTHKSARKSQINTYYYVLSNMLKYVLIHRPPPTPFPHPPRTTWAPGFGAPQGTLARCFCTNLAGAAVSALTMLP